MSNQPPSPFVSSFPFQNVEGNLFPPVCLKSHWDPTEMLRHILPQQKVDLPQDFRPLVKVCKQYVSSAHPVAAPMPPKNMVFPMGGEFYPPGRYAEAIDKESVLRTLDRPSIPGAPPPTMFPNKPATCTFQEAPSLIERPSPTPLFPSCPCPRPFCARTEQPADPSTIPLTLIAVVVSSTIPPNRTAMEPRSTMLTKTVFLRDNPCLTAVFLVFLLPSRRHAVRDPFSNQVDRPR